MVRKLFLVGLVLMFGRGTTIQLGTTLFVATLFLLAHTNFRPYKLSWDNLLRGSTEVHTLFTIMIAVMLRADGDDESSRHIYDALAVATFVGLVALPFVVIVGLQLRDIQTLMQDHLDLLRGREADSSAAAGTTAVDLGMAIRRHELGLQSSVDRQTVLEYFDDPSPGMEVWKDKTIVTHLAAHELQALLEEEEAQLPKSQSFGLHFTDLDSARLILTSLGIRASTVGQLNGGVSICLESMAGLGWSRHGGRDFAKSVGEKLWGSKWYEVMGGEPWPDLEQQIASGRVKGSWPAARDDWGSYAKKLEVVFVVRIPSDRAWDRFVPGRKDVYILSPQDCVDQGDFYFYTNDHIAHCFILKPPSDAAGRRALDSFVQHDEPVRVHYSSSRDGDGGMQDVTMVELRENVAAADVEVVDDSGGFPPKVLSCAAAVARPPDAGDKLLAFHRNIETQREGRQLWEEDVARFTDEEMAAALRAMDKAIPRCYSLTYYFTSKEIAQGICAAGGGLVAADDPTGDHIVVSTRSPVELGWEKNGGSRFQATVGQLLWQVAPADLNQPDGRYAGRLQVMLIVAVPTAVLEDARNQHQRAGLVAIPTELLTDADKYSNAHITKCYALGQGAQLRNDVSAVVALNTMTFGGARGGPPSDVEVGSGAHLVANPLSLLPEAPEASHSMVIEVSAAAASHPISQEELAIYLECIAEVESMDDIVELCNDAEMAIPEDSTMETLQELLSAHYISSAQAADSVEQLHHERPASEPRPVPTAAVLSVPTSITQEELAIYLECIAEVESMDDIVELCNDAEMAIPEDSTMETLQELLSAHYISSAQAADSVEQLHHERPASEPRPVPTRPVPTRPVPNRPVPTRPVVQFEPGAQMIAVKRHPVRKSHKANADHVATLDVGDSFKIVGVEITAGGTKLQIEAHIGSAKKKGKTKTKRGWISPLDRAGHPTVKPAPVLKLETDNPVFEVD
eukprot:COSAG02_NODE_36_length_48934_cov_144.851029_14_plen_968_part_00